MNSNVLPLLTLILAFSPLLSAQVVTAATTIHGLFEQDQRDQQIDADSLPPAEHIGIRLRLEVARLKASLPDAADPRVLEVVEQLRIHRDEVRHFLDHPNVLTQQEGDDLPPTDPCYACGGLMYWRRSTGGYVCAECHPDPRWIPASKKIQ